MSLLTSTTALRVVGFLALCVGLLVTPNHRMQWSQPRLFDENNTATIKKNQVKTKAKTKTKPDIVSWFSTNSNTTTTSSGSSHANKNQSETNNDDIIAWLTMGPARNYAPIASRFANFTSSSSNNNKAKLFYHSFDEPCEGCIFEPKTSFAEGRNLLLETALNYTMNNDDNYSIKYFVFFDDDIQLLCGNSLLKHVTGKELPVFPPDMERRCWELFTDMLLNETNQYPFIKPLLTSLDEEDAFTIKYQSCCDENFKGFHRDYIWFFFPSTTYKEQISWWFNGRSKMYLAQRCLHYAWKVDGNYAAHNPQHRNYPKDEKVNMVQDVLTYTYPELGPWNIQNYKCCHRCEVTDKPTNVSRDLDPLCETALKARFQRWLDGNYTDEEY